MLTYEEFKNKFKKPKYFGQKCFVYNCNNLAEYEGGDARFYCGVCEKHSNIKKEYDLYVKSIQREEKEVYTAPKQKDLIPSWVQKVIKEK